VNGTVTDPSGAVVPGATVVVKNVATNVETKAITNSTGDYSIRFLQVGQYTVTIKRDGFKTFSSAPFSLEVNQTAKIDGKLEVGSETQTVTVENTLQPILDTDNSTLATTFTPSTIQNL